MSNGRVLANCLVAHGRGSDPEDTGFLQKFSNRPGSNASSEGSFLIGDTYHGKHERRFTVPIIIAEGRIIDGHVRLEAASRISSASCNSRTAGGARCSKSSCPLRKWHPATKSIRPTYRG
jgi:hypothetical protein